MKTQMPLIASGMPEYGWCSVYIICLFFFSFFSTDMFLLNVSPFSSSLLFFKSHNKQKKATIDIF